MSRMNNRRTLVHALREAPPIALVLGSLAAAVGAVCLLAVLVERWAG